MAANPLGEEKSPAPSRGFTPARIAVIAALAVVVIALGVVLFGGGGGYQYDLIFQNAGQLVSDNQVLIGGSPVGTVESIELTENNLASVHVSVSQQLHEGTTAVIRATSLSGVANHYVSISPGPNSNPAAWRRRHARPRLDHHAGRHRPALQHLPALGAPRASASSSAATPLSMPGSAKQANQTYKYFGPGAQPQPTPSCTR